MELEMYYPVFELLSYAGAISLPLVVVCGLVERMYNALFDMINAMNSIQKTENDLIYVARPMEFNSEYLFEKINYTKEIIEDASPVEIVNIIKELVPTFYPNNDNYRDKKEKLEEAKV